MARETQSQEAETARPGAANGMDAEARPADASSAEGSSQGGQSTKLFLGGLSWETTEDKLRQYFAKYGDIVEVIVMKDRITSKPRGFGFITFKEAGQASRACADVHTIDGRTIDAKPSFPQSEGSKPRSKKIFVGGLAPDTTEDQFTTYFEQFGKILEAQIMQDHTSGRSRGFGFVTFEHESAVDKVFAAGSMHDVNGKKVEVKNATPKGSGPQGARGAAPGRGGPGATGSGPGRGYYGAGRFGEYGQYSGAYGLNASYGMPPGMMGYGPGYGAGYMPGAYGNPYGGMMVGTYPGYYGGAYGSSSYMAGQAYNQTQSPSGSASTPQSPSATSQPYPSVGGSGSNNAGRQPQKPSER